MNRITVSRSVIVCVLKAFLTWFSPWVLAGESPDAANEDEFWRTTYCVAGGLPMEIQFSIEGNPLKLGADSFDLNDIDRIGNQLDVKVAALLKDSVTATWRQTYGDRAEHWSSELSNELVETFVLEIAARAPKSLGISFCGDGDQVGSAAYTAIFGYFSRAVQLEGGRAPSWLADRRSRSKGGIIVMLAVALRLAHIQFDAEELVRTLAE